MKVTEVPAQLFVPGSATTVTDGTTLPVTETWAALEFVVEQCPLWTTARKDVVAVSGSVENGLAVELISTHVKLLVEDCHFTIEPVWPVSEIVVPLPLQTVAAVGLAVPPTETGLIAAVVVPATEAQLLIVTHTLYKPPAANVTLLMIGFCWVELNPFGPLQL